MENCRFYARGHCARGKNCRFLHLHDYNHRHQIPGIVPACRFFQKGHCRSGNLCKFSHAPSTGDISPLPVTSSGNGSASIPVNLDPQLKGSIATQKIGGVELVFGDGLEITSFKLPEPDIYYNSLPLSSITVTQTKPTKYIKLIFRSLQRVNGCISALAHRRRLFLSGKVDGTMSVTQHHRRRLVLTIQNILSVYSETDLMRHIDMSHCWETALEGPPTYVESTPGEKVCALIERHAHVVKMAVFDSDASTITVNFRLANAEEAQHIINSFNGVALPALGGAILRIQRDINVKLTVRNRILKVLRNPFEDIMRKHLPQVTHRVMVEDHIRESIDIFIRGKDADAVARAKAEVNILFAGVPAMDGDKILWHPKFNTTAGLEAIQEIMKYTNTYIFRDRENLCLQLYGSVEARSLALANLLGEVEVLERPMHKIRISLEDYTACLNGRLQIVKEMFGNESVRVEITKAHRYVLFNGHRDDYTRTLELLKVTPLDDAQYEGPGGCPVCFTPPENPLTLSCGHIYCTDCFVNQCEISSDGSLSFPLACVARLTDVNCGKPIELGLLRALLPATVIEKLFKASLSSYVKSRPEEYRNCPTPDCTSIYRIYTGSLKDNLKKHPDNTQAPIPTFHCPGCLSAICTRCQLPTHNPFTCADAVDISRGGDGLFSKWKAKHGVRDCPKCRVPIEKIDGCNHMECMSCGTHMCWFCMKLFEFAEDVYEHMESQHAGEVVSDGEHENGGEDEMDVDDDAL